MASKGVQLVAFCLAIAVVHARAPSKIINGHTAYVGEFPYQVAITRWGKSFCGGAIIDSTHILTAAHCVVDGHRSVTRASDIFVVTGTNDIDGGTETNTFPVSRVTPHSEFNSQINKHNDIAVLTLAKPIPFNSYQSPIRLPTKDTPVGAMATTSGWGKGVYRKGSPGMKKLQKLQMKVISVEDCQNQWTEDIWANQICVFANKNSGTCEGDSGGPLAYNDEIIGVTSFGLPCAKGRPDVFTRVYKYLSWIRNAMRY